MSQDPLDDLREQVCLSLRMTLAYLSNHAHLRELFTIQEMLSRHAADVDWKQSQQSVGIPMPKDFQEMPEVLRAKLSEMELHQRALKDQYAQRIMQESRHVAPKS